MNYTIGDFVIQLKNAAMTRKKEVVTSFANIKEAVAKVLVKEGFLASVKTETIEGRKMLVVELRYSRRRPTLTDVALISKPSLRVYVESKEIASKQGRSETAILSTNAGILTGRDAIKKKAGGELLFKIW
ncbi:MAG TPA: 30S ribosomal protein S8 [Patescibacteria group bacterium]|nr:30S ribosomal protein S8 [Patescibacteria group bacterium]